LVSDTGDRFESTFKPPTYVDSGGLRCDHPRVQVDHSTINRWVIKYNPQLEEVFYCRKRPVWTRSATLGSHYV